MRRLRAVGGLLIVGVLFAGSLPAGARDADRARLELGDAAFFRGPRIHSSYGSITGDYTCGERIQCFDYRIDVREPGLLRVALDIDDSSDRYRLLVFDKSRQVAAATPLYSAELYVSSKPASYTVRVEARRVTDGKFRVRVKLDHFTNPSNRSRPRRPLLPNMRLLPPFKFTFSSAAYTPAGESSGCAEDETVENRPVRCLRFSLGPANFGDGPLELRYEALKGVVQEGKIYQRIHFTDGTTEEREAGEFEYHTTHGHFHHAGFGSLELLRVTNPKTGSMEPAGDGPKQGFCMVPYMIVDWRSFNNDRAGSARSDCFEFTPATGSHMGLDRGWADIYEWYLSGNYVDFGSNPDGLYVVRSMTDAGRDIRETNEKDNWGYAYIRITGDDVDVLERGYGRSPWDPRKIVESRWLLPTL